MAHPIDYTDFTGQELIELVQDLFGGKITEIKEKLDRAASLVVVDARGLTVEQDTILRKELREAGVSYKVYKNTMMNFAFAIFQKY